MTSKIAAVEDALEQKIRAVLGSTVRTVEWAPQDWDEDFIKRKMLQVPGVFMIFGGGTRNKDSALRVAFDTRWAVVAVAEHPNDAKLRARGDAPEIGCYDIIEALAPSLDEFDVSDVGKFSVEGWDNDEALKLDGIGLMIQSLSLSMQIDLDSSVDLDALAAFKVFHDTQDVGQEDDAPVTEQYVELEQ